MRAHLPTLAILLLLALPPEGSHAQVPLHSAASGPVAAQGAPDPAPGDSLSGFQFWVRLELGYGVASPVCAACGEEGTQGGTTGNVMLGFVFDRRYALGLEASVWVDGAGLYQRRDDKIYRTFFALIFCHYPWEDDGWFGKAGLGYAAYNAYNRYTPPRLDNAGKELPSQVHGEGGGVLLGIGYDIQLARELLLSPTLTYTYGSLGSLELNGVRALSGQTPMGLLQLNLAIAFRSEE